LRVKINSVPGNKKNSQELLLIHVQWTLAVRVIVVPGVMDLNNLRSSIKIKL